MAWCPITKLDCRSDCAWFKESRRKFMDHIEGKCSLVSINHISDELKEINNGINRLEHTINNKDFAQ